MNKLKVLLVMLAPSLAIGFLIGLYPGYRAYEYAWKDAGFCISCHVHDYASVGWKDSIHGERTTCHDCHHQPLKAYMIEAYLMVTKPPKFPKDLHHTPYVKKELCGACHLSTAKDFSTLTGPTGIDQIADIPKVDRSFLHKVHLSKKTRLALLNEKPLSEEERAARPQPQKNLSREEGPERPITCADCHGGPTNRGHNFSAVDVTCVRCHQKQHQGKMIPEQGCRSCHFSDFLAPVSKTFFHPDER